MDFERAAFLSAHVCQQTSRVLYKQSQPRSPSAAFCTNKAFAFLELQRGGSAAGQPQKQGRVGGIPRISPFWSLTEAWRYTSSLPLWFPKGTHLLSPSGRGRTGILAGASQKPFTVAQQRRASGTTLPSAGPSICCSTEFSSSLIGKKNPIPSVQHHGLWVRRLDPLEKCSWL